MSCGTPKDRDPEPMEIEIVGQNRQWTARYAGPDGKLHSEDDILTPGEITVSRGVPVTLHLKSRDYLYLFSLPHENLSEIAVPDLDFQIELIAREISDFPLVGGELCGRANTVHGILHVRDPRD